MTTCKSFSSLYSHIYRRHPDIIKKRNVSDQGGESSVHVEEQHGGLESTQSNDGLQNAGKLSMTQYCMQWLISMPPNSYCTMFLYLP